LRFFLLDSALMTPINRQSPLDAPRAAVFLGLARLAQKILLGAAGLAIDLPRALVERLPSLLAFLVILATPVAWAAAEFADKKTDAGLEGLNATQAFWREIFDVLALAAGHSGRHGVAQALGAIANCASWGGFRIAQPVALLLVWAPVCALAVALWVQAVRTRVAAGGVGFPFATISEIEEAAKAWGLPEVVAPKMSPCGPRAALGRWRDLGKSVGPIMAGDLVLMSSNLVAMLLQTVAGLALGIPFMVFMAGVMAGASSLMGGPTSGSQGTDGAAEWILLGFAGLCAEFLAVAACVAWRRKKKPASQLALSGQPAMSWLAFVSAPWRGLRASAAQKLAALGEADLAAREAKTLAREVAVAKAKKARESGRSAEKDSSESAPSDPNGAIGVRVADEGLAKGGAASARPRRL